MNLAQRDNLLATFLFVVSVLALSSAWVGENIYHMVPCALCLWERWPWRLLMLLSLFVFLTNQEYKHYTLLLCLLPLLTSLLLSTCHLGVEWGWWQSPLPACHAPHLVGSSLMQRWNEMPLRPERPCDAPVYLLTHPPISMTMLDGCAALSLIGLVMIYMLRRKA